MPLEFDCPSCHEKLRVRDEAAGKMARCPKCRTVSQIPAMVHSGNDPAAGPRPATPPPPPPNWPASPPSGTSPAATQPDNPYAAPASPITSVSPPGTALAPSQFRSRDVLALTWSLVKQSWGRCILLTLLIFGLSIALNMVSSLILVPFMVIANDNVGIMAIMQLVSMVLQVFIQTIFTIVLVRFGLNILVGRDAWQNLFQLSGTFLHVFLAQVVQSLIGVVFIIPLGLFFYAAAGPGGNGELWLMIVMVVVTLVMFGLGLNIFLRLVLTTYFIVDQQKGILPAISLSNQYMRGNKLPALGAWLVFILVAMLWVIVTLGIGMILMAGVFALFMASIYGLATGQVPRSSEYGNVAMEGGNFAGAP